MEAKRLLRKLNHVMQREAYQDTSAISKTLTKLLQQPLEAEVMIGIYGGMGAGKSSMINALLKERKVVPTSGHQACTSVATEVRYNRQTHSKYRAELHFMTPAAAHAKISALLDQIVDFQNTPPDARGDDERASFDTAKDQLCSLFPELRFSSQLQHLTQEDVGPLLATLMQGKKLEYLGTVLRFEDNRTSHFCPTLTRFVGQHAGYWPLLKVVKLFVRAEVLSTGAVLVDLPGLGDNNVARAGVGDEYMKKCSRLWIVAPITRAVNSRMTMELLDYSLRLQVQMDCNLESITVVCTQTDSLVVHEAREIQGMDAKLIDVHDRLNPLKTLKQELKVKGQLLMEERSALTTQIRLSKEDIFDWQQVKDRKERGEEVVAPNPRVMPKKEQEKAWNENFESSEYAGIELGKRKRKHPDRYAFPRPQVASLDEYTPKPLMTPEVVVDLIEPLTLAEIVKALADRDARRVVAESRKREVIEEIGRLESRQNRVAYELQHLEQEERAICIRGRNEWCREQIRRKYADELEDIEGEADHARLGAQLPVMTISWHVYMNIVRPGRSRGRNSGFETTEDTGIPQLQRHCMDETQADRRAVLVDFMSAVVENLHFLSRWCVDEDLGQQLSRDQRDAEVETRVREEENLRVDAEALIVEALTTLQRQVAEHMAEPLATGIGYAGKRLPVIVQSWGLCVWVTYRAVCRRFGTWLDRKRGPLDWNRDLTDPMLKYVATPWKDFWKNQVRGILDDLANQLGQRVRDFHEGFEQRPANTNATAVLETRQRQVQSRAARIDNIIKQACRNLEQEQKEANRSFKPCIAKAMKPVYAEAGRQVGTGTFKAMKTIMERHAQEDSSSMFAESGEATMLQVRKILQQAEMFILEEVEHEIDVSCAGYRSVASGADAREHEAAPLKHAEMRKDVSSILKHADERIKHAISASAGEYLNDPREWETAADDDATKYTDISCQKTQSRYESDDEDDLVPAATPGRAPNKPDARPAFWDEGEWGSTTAERSTFTDNEEQTSGNGMFCTPSPDDRNALCASGIDKDMEERPTGI